MTGPMPWVIAIMTLLTVLAAAAGLGLGSAAKALEGGDRITIQIVQADSKRREAETAAVLAALRNMPGIESVKRLEEQEMRRLLEPWLGEGGVQSDIPIPAMIDVELFAGGQQQIAAMAERVRRVAPSARVDDHAQALAPLARLIDALRWLAAGLVLLMAGATAATVVLAARSALDTHRGTIEVLHLMGATDGQVARLFQRRIALDALFGGALGFAGSLLILWLVGERVSAIGSELIGSAGLDPASWALLAFLPLAGVLLAMAVARWTIIRALRRLS
ncbi:MAG TPA: FtsX-like permease family protein [Allosphingosinicella sp.]|nr:FtsX-like permease family protein [Allosphingosinicella sp.]